MESVVLLGLIGAGYLMNKDKDEKHKTHHEVKPPIFEGSGNSIYDIANYSDSRNLEIDLVNANHELAMQGDSKVIDNLNMSGGRNTLKDNASYDKNIDSISGRVISKDDFLVNDQGIKIEPFFSGSPPNVNLDDNPQMTRHFGGEHAFRQRKRETGQFFELEKDYGNVFGNQFAGARSDQARYVGGMERRNELPFEQEKVVHIDQKSDINRDIDLAYAQRNSVDNTRTLSNQKLSFGGKVLGGKGIEHRGEEGEVFQHKPDADYINTADRWLVTTGAIEAPMIQPENIIKPTNRSVLNQGEQLGPAGAVNFNPSESRPMVKQSTNQQLNVDTNRNMNLEMKSIDDNHNKDSFFSYPNEREVTSERTYEGNIKSVFNGGTEGIYDSIKPTIKQTTLDDSRNGFVGSSITNVPEERLQDTAKPTKKQTTNFEHTGNAGSYLGGTMASDQYYRADLNPNKEIIAQGRAPTTENTKLANGMDTLNVDIKKIESDYFNPRINNPDKVYGEISTETQDIREYTQEKDTLDNVKLADRLDPGMLDPFKGNPYTQSLASFAY
jgi:hypothetical protein